MKKMLLLLLFIPFLSNNSLAQQNEWGNWIMYFGTNRVADNWSIHSDIQYCNHTIAPINIEQFLLHTGVNYHFNKNALVTLGYGYIASHDYKSEQRAPESRENRMFQQLVLTQKMSRFKFQHRYRLEQRWGNNNYRNRARYRLMLSVPLNKPTIEKGTVLLAVFDEIFVNTKKTFFDRNRFYVAMGYQINKMTQVQVGYIHQQVSDSSKNYLQVSLAFNTDFRKKK